MSALIAIVFALSIGATVFGSGSFVGIGDTDACAVVDTGTVGFGESDGPDGLDRTGVQGLGSGASAVPRTVEICNPKPSGGVKVASTIPGAGDLLLLLGALLLSSALIRVARREGLFTLAVAARSRRLGWFLLVGSFVVPVAQWAADGVVVRSAVDDVNWWGRWDFVDISWTLVLVSFGILTVSRVLRQAVALQDDADATI
jgi:hypothetical protein